jgi:hypothetical protein
MRGLFNEYIAGDARSLGMWRVRARAHACTGSPYRRRQRHAFSRGTIAKITIRKLVKRTPYNI